MVTFEEFQTAGLAEGYDEVVERRWEANTEAGTHTHPFVAKAVVAAGEMWLTHGGATRHLVPGDTFQLAKEEPHAERYGSAGATYWVARKNG